MKTKTFILTASIAVCLFVLSGCTSNAGTTNSGVNDKYINNGANSRIESEENPNWGVAPNDVIENENNNMNDYAITEYGISEDLYEKVVDIEGINDCRVYISNNEAYCAVETDDNKELTVAHKNKIRKLIQEEHKDIDKVYFSHGEDVMDKLGDYIKDGIDDIDITLKNMFK